LKKAPNPKKKLGPRKAARRSRQLTWLAVAAVLGLAVYGVSQMSSIAFTEKDIRAVDFSSLDSSQRKVALEAANEARCTCGCGMTLAQCVATDSTCPLRDGNIERIQTMVRKAMDPRPAS
jgi:hypothetical protein